MNDTYKTAAYQNGFRDALKEYTKELENYPSNLQNIHTPFDLCNCIIERLKGYTDFESKDFCVFNLEFIEVLRYDFDVPLEKIWFMTDCKEKAAIARSERYKGVNVMQADFFETLKKKNEGRKFDVVVGNPPYQKATAGGNGQRDLWPDFVEKGLELTKESGYLALIHPNKWRKTEQKLWEKLSKKQIKYLEIHNKQDGIKVFKATTRYDWYILQNTNCAEESIVVDENGEKHNMNLGYLPCLPNYHFEAFWKLLAKKEEKTLGVIYSRTFHGNDKRNMSKEKGDCFKYPCVYGMYQDGTVSYLYSSTKSDHFVPKVILGIGEILYPLIDIKGEYGMTQNAFGIKVDSLEEAESIKKAIESDEFKEIIKATKWSNFQTDWRMFKYFKKDFWKEFVK